MNLSTSLRFPFKGEQPWMNILMVAVCFLIPIVGPIVAMGYGVVVLRMLIEDPNAIAPKFDFGLFGKYLSRGLPGFVIGLILVPVIFLAMGLAFGCAFGGLAMSKQSGIFPILGIAGAVLVYLVTMLLFGIVSIPMQMKAGLEQKIGSGFQMGWVMDFLKRVGGTMLKFQLLIMLMMIPLAPIFCFPLVQYGAIAVLMFVMWHLHAGYYRLYLERGGTPVNFAIDRSGFEPVLGPGQTQQLR